jgi:hypothetical protein
MRILPEWSHSSAFFAEVGGGFWGKDGTQLISLLQSVLYVAKGIPERCACGRGARKARSIDCKTAF